MIEEYQEGDFSALENRMLQMFHFTVWQKSVEACGFALLMEGLRQLKSNPVMFAELLEILRYNYEKIDFLDKLINVGFASPLPYELSGGEQQRVALARALVMNPKLILLDESLSNLDAKFKEEMLVEIKKIQRNLGLTIVHVTHDQYEAMGIADRIAVMNEGKLEQVGPVQEV